MGHNNFRHDIELPGGSETPPASEPSWPSLATRLQARFLASRLDRDLEAGILAEPGSALALHMVRVTSVEERQALARSLRHAVSDPLRHQPGRSDACSGASPAGRGLP